MLSPACKLFKFRFGVPRGLRFRDKCRKRADINSHRVTPKSQRFLYRISKSQHAEGVILKGALLLKTIGIPRARPTMDIDMLRKGKADRATLMALVEDCATLEVDPDGLSFAAGSIVDEEITKNSEYAGTRVLMDARLGNVRLRIQIDFGVGDVMERLRKKDGPA